MQFRRDKNSGAILNIDEDGYKAARLRKQAIRKHQRLEQENSYLKQTISLLSDRLAEIEHLLKEKQN